MSAEALPVAPSPTSLRCASERTSGLAANNSLGAGPGHRGGGAEPAWAGQSLPAAFFVAPQFRSLK